MRLRHLFDAVKPRLPRSPAGAAGSPKSARRSSAARLVVEALEDRFVPASLSISNVWVAEGVSGTHNAQVTVRLSEPKSGPVRVDYNTFTRFDSSATPGIDYDNVSGRLTFAPGETVKAILVPVHGDRIPEWDETFMVRLHHPKGATISNPTAIVTIQDSSPRLAIYGYGGSEAGSYLTFVVYLSHAYDLPVTVQYGTYDSTAIAGQDYVGASGTLTFAPGETMMTIAIDIIQDTIPESDEVFIVGLAHLTNAMYDYDNSWNEGWIYADV